MHQAMTADLAIRLTGLHVESARPDAPVIPERPRRRWRRGWRSVVTVDLQRQGTWLEPADPCRISTSRL